jgi:ABC-type proline/glycine betaine transport system permease subunit
MSAGGSATRDCSSCSGAKENLPASIASTDSNANKGLVCKRRGRRRAIAFPEILLGINQTIMMALAMVAITALIGSRDLGQEIYKALPGADTGRGLLAGLGIAFIGIIASRLIGGWAAKMKQQLGMTV